MPQTNHTITGSITWTTQQHVEMPPIQPDMLKKWLDEVASAHKCIIGPITYIFCNDEQIIDVNRRFLNHDYYTDIITFDYTHGRRISGDIFISLDTVATNAENQRTNPMEELHRVIAHGVLHLCGIDDKGPGQRETMEQHENQALQLLKKHVSI